MEHWFGWEYDIDGKNKFYELFPVELEVMAKKTRWALFAWGIFSTICLMTPNQALMGYANYGHVLGFLVLLYFGFRQNSYENGMFEDWQEGKYPDRPYRN